MGGVHVALIAQNRLVVQGGGVLHGNLGASTDVGNVLQIVKDNVEGVAVCSAGHNAVASGDLCGVHKNLDGILVESKARLGLIVKGKVVGLVISIVAGNRALELEGNLIVDVIVGRILPSAGIGVGSVVDVLDLLLKGRDIALGDDGHIADDLDDVGGVGVRAGAGDAAVLILDEVVTGSSAVGLTVADGRHGGAVQVGTRLNNVENLAV